MTEVGGTYARAAFTYSKELDKRVRGICTRKNLPLKDVLVRLIVIGLDTSQDLELIPDAKNRN